MFTYYAILNAGIFAVAWFKAWRSLNFIGFVFTFVVATTWGALSYKAHHFDTTEPFLILFFLFFVGISILYSLRQPPRLKGLVDSTLVFGTPLVCFGLQTHLVKGVEFGLAYSSLALGVIFTSLSVPLAFDGHWTAVTWSLEGAAMVWIGLRQNRILARNLGLLLQLGAGAALLLSIGNPFDTGHVIERSFLGASLIALAGIVSAYLLNKYRDHLQQWESFLQVPMLIWALLWWYGGAMDEIVSQFPHRGNVLPTAFLGLFVITFAVLAKLESWLNWPTLRYPVLVLLPVSVLSALTLTLGFSQVHLLSGWGWLAWPAMFAVQHRAMYRHRNHWNAIISKLWQLGTFWLAAAVIVVDDRLVRR